MTGHTDHAGLPPDTDPRWEVLGGCPTLGDPTSIEELADRFRQLALATEELYPVVQELSHALGDSGWEGQVADAFHERFGVVYPQLLEQSASLEEAGSALRGWAEQLRALRRRAAGLLRDAEQATAHQRIAEPDSPAAVDAAEELRRARVRAEGLREQHHTLARQAAAVVGRASPATPEHHGDLATDMLRILGAEEVLARHAHARDLSDLADLSQLRPPPGHSQ